MASLIIIALLLLLSSSCNWDYGDAMRLEIEKVTNTLISGVKPGPPSAYVCAMSDRDHLIDDEPGVWAWASCAESLAQPDCTQCV
ncbi:unnamed protein product [Linum trigynum]|uniref:Uncharacterized protein n=1 Tax=Linum trigynum TaxID=586398 RepID=A0AAV2GCY7_9ROSI